MFRHAFIIGAQRSGSTFLAASLSRCPGVEFSQPLFPEPKFFMDASEVALGKGHYEERCFSASSQALIRIEKSTSYLETPEAAKRIKNWYPDATIVAVLRNPVHRAISNYFFSLANGLETLPIEEAFAAEAARVATRNHSTSVSPFAYAQRGHYQRYLREWTAVFPREQVKLILFEDMTTSGQSVAKLVDHLGVDGTALPWSPAPVNAGDYPQNFKVAESFLARLRESYKESVLGLDREWNLGAADRWGYASK
jgi:hypothetical protein